jgi:hypothetical protein
VRPRDTGSLFEIPHHPLIALTQRFASIVKEAGLLEEGERSA